jgi:dephospho-CoA kinase
MAAAASFVVGLTGGIGSGKSRVAALLESLGAGLACSDRIVREIQAAGSEALAEIAAAFGAEMIRPDGELDRARLGERIFRDPSARLRLNEIIHPRVTRRLRAELERYRGEGRAVVVLDIPLLLEGRVAGRGSGAELPFDVVALVWAPEATQLARIIERDGLSEEQALARIRAQMPLDQKREHADVVIDNSGSWEQTEKQVRELYAGWVSAARKRAPS